MTMINGLRLKYLINIVFLLLVVCDLKSQNLSFSEYNGKIKDYSWSQLDSLLLSNENEILLSYIYIKDEKQNILLNYDNLGGKAKVVRKDKSRFDLYLYYNFILNDLWIEFELIKYVIELGENKLSIVRDKEFSNFFKIDNNQVEGFKNDFILSKENKQLTVKEHDDLSLKMFLNTLSGDNKSLEYFNQLNSLNYKNYTSSKNCYCWKYYADILSKLDYTVW